MVVGAYASAVAAYRRRVLNEEEILSRLDVIMRLDKGPPPAARNARTREQPGHGSRARRSGYATDARPRGAMQGSRPRGRDCPCAG